MPSSDPGDYESNNDRESEKSKLPEDEPIPRPKSPEYGSSEGSNSEVSEWHESEQRSSHSGNYRQPPPSHTDDWSRERYDAPPRSNSFGDALTSGLGFGAGAAIGAGVFGSLFGRPYCAPRSRVVTTQYRPVSTTYSYY